MKYLYIYLTIAYVLFIPLAWPMLKQAIGPIWPMISQAKYFKVKAGIIIPIAYVILAPFLFPLSVFDRIKSFFSKPKPKEEPIPTTDVEYEIPD